jgi:hypothetical protein
VATAAGANITTIAGFPHHIFLENLAARADGSVLFSALNREQLWYIAAPADRLSVDSVLVRTFAEKSQSGRPGFGDTFPTPGRP